MPPSTSDIAAWITARLADRVGCAPSAVDVDTPFADYGLASIDAVALVGELEAWLGKPLSPTLLFEYSTIATLAAHVGQPSSAASPPNPTAVAQPSMPIAIVGMACRFPSAPTLDGFWDLLANGHDAIQKVPSDRWDVDAWYHADGSVPGTMQTQWGGFLDQVDQFDPRFFRIAPREANRMDPQQRLLLEVAWEAIEDAGILPKALAHTSTGVFVGISTQDYSFLQGPAEALDDAYIGTGNAASIAANRLSYVLNLKGPSLAVDTACSSSLVAVHLACQSLRNGEAACALVGGVNVMLDPQVTINFSKAGFMAPDGRCKAFDAAADGYVRGEGAGMVILKPLAQAQADGDRIYAVLRGSAVNQDGQTNGLTAPSQHAQESVLRMAYERAQVVPSSVQYVEAHGTGTALGDRIEAHALSTVLTEDRDLGQPCFVGSVKTNIGHLEAGAGIASVIKVALAVHKKTLPASLHFHTPNPLIDFDSLGLRVQSETTQWAPTDTPRRAGISAFGFGGTNAHAILEEAPASRPTPKSERTLLLPLSSHTPGALRDKAQHFTTYLNKTEHAFPAIAYTAAARRMHHAHRLAVVSADAQTAQDALDAYLLKETHPHLVTPLSAQAAKPLTFVFSGQGTEWAGMGMDLLQTEPAFREALEACDDVLSQYVTWSLFEELEADATATRLHQTHITQPVLCAFQIALAALWHSWGIVPDAVVGHSVGELAAAYAAGSLDLDAVLRLAVLRGQQMETVAGQGAMVAVARSAEDLASYLHPDVSLAAINSPTTTILSGSQAAIDAFVSDCITHSIACRPLDTPYAFHSSLMNRVQAPFADALGEIQAMPSQIPFYSTLTGTPVDGATLDTTYWQRQIREAVQFAPAIQALVNDGFGTFVEMSPHPVLQPHIEAISRAANVETVTVATSYRHAPSRPSLLKAAAHLYTAGYDLNWNALTPSNTVVSLPPYPWQRQRYWVDLAEPSRKPAATPKPQSNFEGHAVRSPLTPKGYIWETTISLDAHPYLRDHQVEDSIVFPAAAHISLVHSAAQTSYGQTPVIYEDLTFAKPLVFSDDALTLQVVFEAQDANRISFRLIDIEQPNETLVTGSLAFDSDVEIDVSPFDGRTHTAEAPANTFYTQLAAQGLGYGPSFQQIGTLSTSPSVAFAQLQSATSRPLWPPTLDSCFQTIGAAWVNNGHAGAAVPHRIARLTVAQPLGTSAAVHAYTLPSTNGDAHYLKGSALLVDADNQPLLAIEGLALYPLRSAQKQPSERNLLYTLDWVPQPLIHTVPTDPEPGLWLLFGADNAATKALSHTLSAKGHTTWSIRAESTFSQHNSAFTLKPTRLSDFDTLFKAADKHALQCQGIVFSWSLDATVTQATALAGVTHLLQAMLRLGWRTAPRLWVTTQGAVPAGKALVSPDQSLLWGFCRSLRHEHPELRTTTIDVSIDAVPTETTALVEEVRLASAEDQIALRNTERYVARLKPADATPTLRQEETSTAIPLRLRLSDAGTLDGLAWHITERTQPQLGEVQIQVEASGLNFRDVLKALHSYPGQTTETAGLGDECAGTVVAIGEGVSAVSIGDEVFAIAPHSFSRYVTVSEALVLKKPSTLSFAQAATLPVAYLTAYYALHYLGRLRKGERVLIHSAAGGVGQAAVQWAKHVGASIFATAGSPEKRAWLESQGLVHVMDSRSTAFADEVRTLTNGKGVDVILSAAPGDIFHASLDLLRPHGRFLDIGKQAAPANMPMLDGNRAFFNIDLEQLVTDRPALARELLDEISEHLAQDEIAPLHVESFSARKSTEAFRHIAQAKHKGKLALVWDSETLPANVSSNTPMRFATDAWYMITGGLGALGLATAEWMVKHGARHVVLASRHGPTAAVQPALEALRQAGATVRTEQADVTDASAVANLFATFKAETLPLRGIIHAAGVLDDQTILRQQAASLEKVLAPKVDGAWHLHTQSQTHKLDFFVLYSSAASVVGSPGQAAYAAANAYLDSLAHYRHQQALPALAMNWGPWDQMGFSAAATKSSSLGLRGLERLAPTTAFSALETALRQGTLQVMVLPLNMRHWQQVYPQAAAWPVFQDLLADSGNDQRLAHTRQSVQQTLTALASDADRLTWLEDQLREHIAHVLQWPADDIEPTTSLNDLGFDSLMAIELRNRLETQFGIFLPATFVWNGPTHLRDLAQHVASDLGLAIIPKSSSHSASNGQAAKEDVEKERIAAIEQLSEDEAEALLLAKLADIENQYDA